jgi:S1-C subfamily serine protease
MTFAPRHIGRHIAVAGALALAMTTSAGSAEPAKGAPSAMMAVFDTAGSLAPMLERVIPAVVTILITGETPQPVDFKPRNADGSLPPIPAVTKTPYRAGGSGVIVDRARGHIITNSHVVEGAVRLEVVLSDGRRMLAREVGRDAATDVAVIEVAERDLPELPIGDSDRMRVGDLVVAVGNPYGLEGTATLGIVSALMRSDGAFEDFIQIDAAINPGNSGGALVNAQGELIGINTAGPLQPGKGVGIGFAIPINMAKLIKAELITRGQMKRGSPGLIVDDVTHEGMGALKTNVTRGAHITDVVPGSPAAAAGIKPGGIVVMVGGKPVRNAGEFNTRFGTVPAGTTLPTVIHRDGRQSTYLLSAAAINLKPAEVKVPGSLAGLSGVVVGDITLGHPLYGLMRGAQVLDVPAGTPAYATGLAKGDVIVGLDAAAVRTTDDLLGLADRSGMQYRLRLVRNGVTGWLRVIR